MSETFKELYRTMLRHDFAYKMQDGVLYYMSALYNDWDVSVFNSIWGK